MLECKHRSIEEMPGSLSDQGSEGGLLFYLVQRGNKVVEPQVSEKIQEQQFWATTPMKPNMDPRPIL